MAGNIVDQDKKALKILLMLDATRGEDSTGLAVIDADKDNTIHVHKKVGHPSELFKTDAFDGRYVYKGPRAKAFIGHNRAATRGNVTDKNAHPFHHGDVVGAHNGTLHSTWGLEDGYKFEVDSEAIFYNLNKYKVSSVIPDVDGAYALTWYDGIEDKLFIIRNNQRPLFHTRRKDKDVIFWASEAWMLEVALAKAGIAHDHIVSFNIDKLYSLDLSDVSAVGFRKTDLVEGEKIEGYKWVNKNVVTTNNKPTGNHVFNQQGGKPNNVVPFVGSSSTSSSNSSAEPSPTKEEFVQLGCLEGEEILFHIGDLKTGLSKNFYLECYPADPMVDYNIRIYGANDKRWEEWKKASSNTIYRGKMKRLVNLFTKGKKEWYFLLDLRSIVETGSKIVEKPSAQDEIEGREKPETFREFYAQVLDASNAWDDDMQWYEGYDGRFLSHKDWLKATSAGCAHCSANAETDDLGLTWTADDEFLCGECAPMYADYKNVSH